jgi:chromosome segregation ATPase
MTLKQMIKHRAKLEKQIDALDIEWENLRDEMDAVGPREVRKIHMMMDECDFQKEELQEELEELQDEIKYERS